MDYSLKLNKKIISDIHTGKGYSESLKDSHILDTVLNTDGIQPFKSSQLAIWPIYFAFSNLPPTIRMNKDNLVTAVFWVGTKPPMQVLLKALQEVMNRLQVEGLTIKLPSGVHTFQIYPLFGVFDLMAKAPILNMIQHNGSHGCPTCLQQGESYQRCWVYLPNGLYTERTHEGVIKDACSAITSNCIVNGIKGKSVLANLIDVIDGVPVDYMHCVLEGITKKILQIWIRDNARGMASIDALLMQQHPPHDFSRPPRSILHHKYWKASEYRNWLLYYSLPLLSGVLPPLHLHHFALLVCSMHMLLQECVKEVEIRAAEDMLTKFYELLPELYGNECCTINAHLLIHLTKYVCLWGPLWTHSAFGFESFNGHLTGMINSKQKIGEQLLYSLEVSSTLANITDKLQGVESEATLKYLNMSWNCYRCNMSQIVPGTYSVGPLSAVSAEELALVRCYFGQLNTEVHSFDRLYHNNSLYHSVQYGREGGKRNSTVCCYRENHAVQLGVIQRFAVTSESVGLALISPFERSTAYLKTIGNPGREVLKKYSEVDLLSVFVFPVKKALLPVCVVPTASFICKCVLLNCTATDYVIKIPNNFEHH